MQLRRVQFIILALTVTRIAAAQPGGDPLRAPNHTAWTTSEVPALAGAFRIARSNDGYLWLNTAAGVLRFDGTRFMRFDTSISPLLAVRGRGSIRPLLVDRSGTLWLQRPDKSLLTYRDGVFHAAVLPDSALAVQLGTELGIDAAGELYLYNLSNSLAFAIAKDGRLQRVQWPSTFPTNGIARIVPDTGRGMWIGAAGLWHSVNGQTTRVQLSAGGTEGAPIPLLQTRDGALWITGFGARRKLARIVNGTAIPVRAVDSSDIIDAYQAVEAANGAVWISTRGHGVLLWRQDHLEQFNKRDGLTDVLAYDISVDAHGVAFVATPSGLDRFRPTPFATLGREDGVPVEAPSRVLQDASGSVWLSGVDAPAPIELRIAKTQGGRESLTAVRTSLPVDAAYTLLGPAKGGGIWVGTRDGDLIQYRSGVVKRWTRADGLPGTPLRFLVEGHDGTLWIGTGQLELWMSRGGHFTRAPVEFASDVVEDLRGHVWVADANAIGIAEIANGRVLRRFGRAEGVRGFAGSLALDNDNVLWSMTDSGLVRVSDGRVSAVPGVSIDFVSRYGPDMLAADKFLWFVTDSHIQRIPLSTINAIANGQHTHADLRSFGARDGLVSPRRFAFQTRTMFHAKDGRVWFATPSGLGVFDQTYEPTQRTPRINVEEFASFGGTFHDTERVSVAPNPDRITLHFTAPNLAWPEYDHIQYRLDGVDHDWIDAGDSRAATYTLLRPRDYRFHARAWSVGDSLMAQESTIAFHVQAAWYQLLSLRIALVLAAFGLLMRVLVERQRRRAQIATVQLQTRFDARLAERSRIARELHDTLLQGVTGVVLHLEGFRQTFSRMSSEAATDELTQILVLADRTLFEARQSVWDIRTHSVAPDGLAISVEATCAKLASADGIRFSFSVVGSKRRLLPEIEATALDVVREAMRNVVAHARAQCARVELCYEPRSLRVSVVDDGVGTNSAGLDGAARKGHFGIVGMRERAAAAGGTFELVTGPNEGTRINIMLPCPG